MSTFVLRIELGNAAMQTPQDVARSLEDLAEDLAIGRHYYSGPMRDVNGNTVGRFTADWPQPDEGR